MKKMITAAALLLAAGCTVQSPNVASRSTPSEPAASASASVEAAAAAPSLNAFRSSRGLRPLSRSAKLDAVAQAHARDMQSMNRMTHTGSNGSQMTDRLQSGGYRYRTAAENVAQTGQGMDRVMELWINSPGHRSNMLKTNVTEYGVGRAGDFYTMVLAAPR
ncbi:CAP domain-containing protein [Salipiger sp.]|uniref:CAP domain-containing protein n=1 Tax=Salipiger sp. TaxID=2078585 RepID=UPI003A971958